MSKSMVSETPSEALQYANPLSKFMASESNNSPGALGPVHKTSSGSLLLLMTYYTHWILKAEVDGYIKGGVHIGMFTVVCDKLGSTSTVGMKTLMDLYQRHKMLPSPNFVLTPSSDTPANLDGGANMTFNGYPTEAAFLEAVPYSYIPTTWICIVFLVLFSVSTLLHLFQGIWFHMWWSLPTVVMAGLGEIIGWAARLWSSKSPLSLEPFMIQMSSTIIAPTPLLAINFLILSHIISLLGPQYSRLSPKRNTIIFCTVDILALCVQGIGGAKASHAVSNDEDPEVGGRIMLGGIVIQMASLVVYAVLVAEFLARFRLDKPLRPTSISVPPVAVTRRLKLQIVGLAVMILAIFIRTVYRTSELAEGWDGDIVSTQSYFNIFDGAMMVIAMFTLNIFHPGRLFDELRQRPAVIPTFDGKFRYFQESPPAYNGALPINNRTFRPYPDHELDPYAVRKYCRQLD